MARPDEAATDPDNAAKILALPPQQRIARLVAMQPAEADAFFKSLRGPQRSALIAGMQPELRETVGALENPQRTVAEELIAQRLTRDIYSNAQLEEVGRPRRRTWWPRKSRDRSEPRWTKHPDA